MSCCITDVLVQPISMQLFNLHLQILQILHYKFTMHSLTEVTFLIKNLSTEISIIAKKFQPLIT